MSTSPFDPHSAESYTAAVAYDWQARVDEIQHLGGHFVRLSLALDEPFFQQARPGQFVMLEAPGTLLRRPFSLLNVPAPDRFDLLVFAGGAGANLLAVLQRGARLRGLGPLGNGFATPPADHAIVCVGGGFGLAPFHFAICHWGQTAAVSQPLALFAGARSISDVPFLGLLSEGLERWPSGTLHLSTEDGSHGRHGLITDDLVPYLEERRDANQPVIVYGCGPQGLLQALATIGARLGVRTQVSLGERMACGWGACHGCIVPRSHPTPSDRFVRVCYDGPVFDAETVTL